MPICGIIAEFNPFHNGHHALIQAARDAGSEKIVCVMSGNFVQRGSLAITDKSIRARAALACGADLIIELPVSSAVATAQRFAKGAIYLLNSLGCVDTLAFGSESGEVSSLQKLASVIENQNVIEKMRENLKLGITFAKARELAVEEIFGEDLSSKLSKPNNNLAIEYLSEAEKQGLKAKAFTIKRIGVDHDSTDIDAGFASASYLRANSGSFELLSEHVPKQAAEIYSDSINQGLYPTDASKLEVAILAHLRRLSIQELEMLPDISEGLHNRMYAAIRKSTTLDELMLQLKTKRYTMARIRRLILSAFLGITAIDSETLPPYVRVLGFNEAGRELLTDIKKGCTLPLSTSLADLRAQGVNCQRFAYLEALSTDLYTLASPKDFACGFEYTRSGEFKK